MEYPAFFGEVLPVISRAVDEDEEDFDQHETICEVSVRWTPLAKDEMKESNDGCIQCNVLFIAIGQEASGFVKTFLVNDQTTELLGTMCSGVPDDTSNTWSQRGLADRSCFIERLKDKPAALFVHCTLPVTPQQAPSWTDQLFSHLNLKTTYVAVLTTDLTSHYYSEVCHNDLPAPFLRALNTSTFKGTPCVPYLEQPNVISGLPAQIMTYLEIHGVAAVFYVCYKDVSFVDIKTMKLFCKILHSTPIKDYAVDNPDAANQLVQLAELHQDKNTLYI